MKSIHLWPELPTVPEEHVQTIKGYVYEKTKKKVILKVVMKNGI